jgi:hypothetical protein
VPVWPPPVRGEEQRPSGALAGGLNPIEAPGHGVPGGISHIYRPDSYISDVAGKNADVIWVGCENDPAPRSGRSGDHDRIDGCRYACHCSEALQPRCGTGDRIGERNDLELLQHLVGSGVTFITHESLGQNRCRYKDGDASLARRRQDCSGVITVIPRYSPEPLAVEHN